MYQAGTLSGNPLALAAGFVMLSTLNRNASIYSVLESRSKRLEMGIRSNLQKLGLDYTLNRVGSMFTLFFTAREVVDYDSAKSSDTKIFSKYFGKMLEQGIYFPPSQFEAAFISAAHSVRDIDRTIKANYEALKHTMQ